VAVIESDLRQKAAVFFSAHLSKEFDMLLKLLCINHIGILAGAWPKVVIEKIKAVQRRRCSFFRD
jgi:hypothetical protein